MKISYNWLLQYIKTDVVLNPELVAEMLTNCGLEVEATTTYESVEGGLQGLVVGEVKTKGKHPNADKLSVTTVEVGNGRLLKIVCGAANVEAGQRVIVALPGATLYPISGDSFTIKETKIRGEESCGMICAEDEIGMGTSHDGIMVLPENTVVGTPAAEYFHIYKDHVFEIGLTPNRADAISHIGVARDLATILSLQSNAALVMPATDEFKTGNGAPSFPVELADSLACPRYTGLNITGVRVGASPAWLRDKLTAIGLKSINNIVDISNYVMHETGQPLHIFDADAITGNKVIVKTQKSGTEFATLDGVVRKLAATDLMICNEREAMCIAGVFGGASSGVSAATVNIFIESACFSQATIRKTSKHHGLKTDASFRFERGTDPDATLYAIKRAALLLVEVAGGEIASAITDVYPSPATRAEVNYHYATAANLAGVEVSKDITRKIFEGLGIEIRSESGEGMVVSVPGSKVDVTREVDLVEEILRVYGYNNIPEPAKFSFSPQIAQVGVSEGLRNGMAQQLAALGFVEMMSNSLTRSSHYGEDPSVVSILNPLSNELDVLRKDLFWSGMEVVAYNTNRQSADLKLFEFGSGYLKQPKGGYAEPRYLSLFVAGKRSPQSWMKRDEKVSFYYFKAVLVQLLAKAGVKSKVTFESLEDHAYLAEGLTAYSEKKPLANIGLVKSNCLKKADIKHEVYFAEVNWDVMSTAHNLETVVFTEIPKYPSVRRDLSLVIDKKIGFEKIKSTARVAISTQLKEVNLFDVFEDEKLGKDKICLAVSFVFRDDNKTLTDKGIDSMMQRIIKAIELATGATLRQ